MPNEPPAQPPGLSSKIPKATHRLLRDYAHEIESHRHALLSLRDRLVEDIEENEAVGNAMKRQLRDIDRTLRTAGED